MKRSPKRDVAQDITNLIIRKIEEGTLTMEQFARLYKKLEKTGVL